MQHVRASDRWTWSDDGIELLDDALVELVEEPPVRRPVLELVEEPTRPTGMRVYGDGWRSVPAVVDLDDAVTRVWIRPYAARLRLVGGR